MKRKFAMIILALCFAITATLTSTTTVEASNTQPSKALSQKLGSKVTKSDLAMKIINSASKHQIISAPFGAKITSNSPAYLKVFSSSATCAVGDGCSEAASNAYNFFFDDCITFGAPAPLCDSYATDMTNAVMWVIGCPPRLP